MTSENRNNFDLIRLIAACQVVINHTIIYLHVPGPSSAVLHLVDAFPGVPVFFVVSGFLVTRSFVEGSGGTIGYAFRRALRIYPGLWTQYLVILSALAVTGALTFGTLFTATFWQWVAGAFVLGSDFWGNIVANAYPFSTTGFYKGFPSDVLWTIGVELGFYVLVPFVFSKPVRDRGLTWLLIAICAAASLYFQRVLVQEYAAHPGFNTTGELFGSPLPFFWVFLIGGTIFTYWRHLHHLFVGKLAFWLVIYTLMTTADITYFGHGTIDLIRPVGLMLPRMVVLGCLVISFAYTAPWLSSWLRADLSYGVYLYHMPLIFTLVGFGFSGHRWLWLVVFGGSLVIASLSWSLIEKPALGLKRHSGRIAAFAERYLPKMPNLLPERPAVPALVEPQPHTLDYKLISLLKSKDEEIARLKIALADAVMARRNAAE